METLTPPENALIGTEPELHLLPDSELKTDWLRYRGAAVGTVFFHVLLTLLLARIDLSPPAHAVSDRVFLPHVTPLYIPRDLTQRVPNKEPVRKELTVASIAPHPVLKAPFLTASGRQAQAAKSAPLPPPQTPSPAPAKPQMIEPPRIEAAMPNLPPAQLPKTAPLPPAPTSAPPKIALEDVAPAGAGPTKPTGLITMPSTTLADQVRKLTRSGAQQGLSISDEELGSGGGLNLPASAGRPRTEVRLLFDPLGVDFRAYIIQVIAAVRRNWFAVYPEAARLGQRGQVVLKFVITKRGTVGTVNFSSQSGSRPLDQSAVAALSASNPLPPLPAEFRGDQIVLQMTFSYNMPR